MTLEEWHAKLKAEGRYDAMIELQRQQDEELQRRAAEWARVEQPLAEELRAAGFAVDSAWDLVNTSVPYPKALPILLEHLERPYPWRVREGIARALAVRDAKFAWGVLLRLFKEEKEKMVKDGLACALAAASDDDVIGDLIDLVRDPTQVSRVLLLTAFDRSADPRARTTLMELGADPVFKDASRLILRKMNHNERRKRKR